MTLAADLHHPAPGVPVRGMLICWPGGSYSRAYWDMHVPRRDGYSFAEHAVAQGFVVARIDPLGVGDSPHPEDVDSVTLEAMADAAAETVRDLRAEHGGPEVPVIGIGHSLGGCLTVVEQALHGSYDAIANLGFTHGSKAAIEGVDVGGLEQDPDALGAAAEQAKLFFGGDWDAGYALAPRELHHAWLHAPDVPADVIAADDELAARWPRQSYVGALLGGYSAGFAARVTCPAFVAFGDQDVPEHPHDDAGFYRSSPDVTVFVLAGSAHCHNFATTRTLLWDRLLLWAATVPHRTPRQVQALTPSAS